MIAQLRYTDGHHARQKLTSSAPGPAELIVEKPGDRPRCFRRTGDQYNGAVVYREAAR